MKVYVENKDKDFLELCLKEHCVYDYIEYDSRYRDKLELVSLSDYTKQVRKEVIQEINDKINQAKIIYEWKGEEITIEYILDKIKQL